MMGEGDVSRRLVYAWLPPDIQPDIETQVE